MRMDSMERRLVAMWKYRRNLCNLEDFDDVILELCNITLTDYMSELIDKYLSERSKL